jgi:hypothetical protein
VGCWKSAQQNMSTTLWHDTLVATTVILHLHVCLQAFAQAPHMRTLWKVYLLVGC